MGIKVICPNCGSIEISFWEYDDINDKIIHMCEDCGELIIDNYNEENVAF